jgi:CRP/FNR family transcriptional regulator, cyclic AMP receptor protein
MENLDERAQRDAQACCSSAVLYNANTVNGSEGDLDRIPMRLDSGPKWNDANAEWRAGEFYKDLSPKAMSDFESRAATYCCEGSRVLFAEEQEPCSLLFLLEGRVKLTMNSSEGKRLTLGIAMPGDVLGLAAVLTGCPYEITAVAQFPCRIRALPRKSFLYLLLRNPVAWQNSARLLSVEYKRGCERLRILGLALTAPMKLAMLLLQWCAGGQRAELGVRIHCSLTHEEIGEYIGLSRETVTRTLADFKNLDLVEQHGTVFSIPSLRALEIYAGQFGC